MDIFAGVVPFVATAEERSFRRAAQRLEVTPAAVSKAVARLEADLRVRLLNRTSRHVALTPEGAAFLERCRAAVDSVQAGRELVSASQRVVQGELRASLPQILGRFVVPRLPALVGRHPDVSFRLSFTDRFSRLVEEDIDVAVRIGALEDSSLVARRLRTPRWVTVAAPSYLARRGTPQRPEDLARHDCLKFILPRGGLRAWAFTGASKTPAAVAAPARFSMDNGDLLLQAALAGLGVCQVLDFMLVDELREGRLVALLAPFAAPGPPIHALCLPRRQSAPRIRAFLRFLVEILGQEPPASGRPRRGDDDAAAT